MEKGGREKGWRREVGREGEGRRRGKIRTYIAGGNKRIVGDEAKSYGYFLFHHSDYVYMKTFSPVNAPFLMRLHFPFT